MKTYWFSLQAQQTMQNYSPFHFQALRIMEAFYAEQRDWIEKGEDFRILFILQSILFLTQMLRGSLFLRLSCLE
jgi:hypothetical protein